MKKVLVITPYCLEYVPFHKWLDLNTCELYVIMGEESIHPRLEDEPRNILNHFKEFHIIKNINTNPAVIIKAREIIEKNGITHITAVDEYGMERAALLRDIYNLPGQRQESAKAYRKKNIMKKLLENKVRVPQWSHGNTEIDLILSTKNMALPFVFKNVDGAGSVGTQVIKTKDDLNMLISSYETGLEFLVEEFIDAEMFHIDGYFHEGEMINCWVSKYYNDCLSYQENKPLGSMFLPKESEDFIHLKNLTMEVLKSLPSAESSPYHAEFWKTKDNEYVFCEIGARCGGGGIREAFKHSMNIDFCQTHALAQTDSYIDFANIGDSCDGYMGWLLVPPKKARLLSVADTCQHEDVIAYQVDGVVGTSYNNPAASVSRIQKFVVKKESKDEVIRSFDELMHWSNETTLWES